MIRYALVCDRGHDFESWFRDAASYDSQAAAGHLACPVCGTGKVGKAIMAPQLARKDREPAPVALMSPEEAALRAKLKALRAEITRSADYVGRDFADEARRMHEGEIDHRSIYGEAEPAEVRALLEDGIEVFPLPPAIDDRN